MKQSFIFLITLLFFKISISQINYTFIGNGNWNNPTNWNNNIPPPTPIPNGSNVIINPTNGECIVNVPVTISPNSNLTVISGKNLILL